MIWFSLRGWTHAGGVFFAWKRLQIGSRWTPIILGWKRYDTWLGFWG